VTQVAPERAPQAPTRPIQRYAVRQLSGALHWGILDRHMGAWCSLADGGCFLPLEWKTAEEAQVWLYLCRIVWGSGLVEPPQGWYGR
jgi:hypothetical protein